MLQSEFETLTDIFPDAILYGCIEQEYMKGFYDSKAQFCTAYKFNEGGLAEKIQRAANARLIELGEGATPKARKTRMKMAETIRDLTDELETIETAYEKVLKDMLSPSLFSLVQKRVRDELR